MRMCSELAKLHSVAPPTTDPPPPHVDKYDTVAESTASGSYSKGLLGLAWRR